MNIQEDDNDVREEEINTKKKVIRKNVEASSNRIFYIDYHHP